MTNKLATRLFVAMTIILLSFLIGCTPILDLAMTGAGSSAKIEKINFFKTTNDFMLGGAGLPDLYFIAPNINWNKYNKIVFPNFTSMADDINKVSSLQMTEYKNLRQDIPDNIARTFDGGVFPECTRITEKISPLDINSIRNIKADAILLGNISQNKSGIRSKHGTMLTATQVEIKLVDIKTGQEIIKMINRSSTDNDKVSMPIVRALSKLIQKAKQ